MANVINKVKDFFGLDDEYDDEYDEMETEEGQEEELEVEPTVTGKRQNKVVSIHSGNTKNTSTQILIIKPENFDEVVNICDSLKERKIVVVNTNSLEAKVAQRLLDFMGGACYSLGGELQEADKGVYVLSPSNIEVTNEFKSELSSKGLFNWK